MDTLKKSIKDKLVASNSKLLGTIFVILFLGITLYKFLSVQETIATQEIQIRNSLTAKGSILTENNSIALRDLAVNNAIIAVNHLVTTTVKQDHELEYGIFMDQRLVPWVNADKSDTVTLSSFSLEPLRDSMALWAFNLDSLGQKSHIVRGQEIIEFAAPVIVEEEKLGVIRYGFSLSILKESLHYSSREEIEERNTILGIIVVISILSLGISIFLARRFAKKITAPILSLVESTQQISEGHYDLAIPVQSSDEIGELAEHVSKMQQSIREKISALDGEIEKRRKIQVDLEKAHEFLEHRVAERTEELRITNEKLIEANATAVSASKAKSIFLANMSHEIRTPMNAILGFTEVLQKKTKEKELQRYLSIISGSGNSLLKLINDILDLSKVEAGKLEIELQPFSIVSLCQEIVAMFEPKTKEKGIQLQFSNSLLPHYGIILDEVRVREILVNLVGNAIKFTPQGTITIYLSNQPLIKNRGTVQLSVQDSGIGIPADQVHSIFGAFDQVKGQKNSEYGGTGLGLSITKKLTELMNGTIRVESSEGEGSSFVLTFNDVEFTTEYDSGLALSQESVVIFEENKIVIADQSEETRELLECYFADSPLAIFHAKTGTEALELIRSEQPRLLLVNLNIPEISGLELAKIITLENLVTSVIVMTASVVDQEYKEIESVAADFLVKPISQKNLLDSVQKILPFVESEKPSQSKESTFGSHRFEGSSEFIETLKTLDTEIAANAKMVVFSEISKLAEKLKNISELYSNELLRWYSCELFNATESYDIGMIVQRLNQLEKAIQNNNN